MQPARLVGGQNELSGQVTQAAKASEKSPHPAVAVSATPANPRICMLPALRSYRCTKRSGRRSSSPGKGTARPRCCRSRRCTRWCRRACTFRCRWCSCRTRFGRLSEEHRPSTHLCQSPQFPIVRPNDPLPLDVPVQTSPLTPSKPALQRQLLTSDVPVLVVKVPAGQEVQLVPPGVELPNVFTGQTAPRGNGATTKQRVS